VSATAPRTPDFGLAGIEGALTSGALTSGGVTSGGVATGGLASGGLLSERLQVRQLQDHLEELRRRRWRKVLLLGIGLSFLIHASLLLYLATVYRAGGGGDGAGGEPVIVEFSFLPQGELAESASLAEGDLTNEIETAAVELPSVEAPLLSDAAAPAGVVGGGTGTGLPTLGGSGSGGGGTGGGAGGGGEGGGGVLGGGAGGTSFFGVSSKGTRFAYIVDRSMSMAEDSRLEVAKRELVRSIDALPDYANFCVIFYSSELLIPEMQDGWLRARGNIIARFAQWLANVSPGGGTVPGPAFITVLSMPVRPDVIFFMTDGEISNFTPEEVAALNRRGKHVVINTIAFGEPGSQELLKQIAHDSGGTFRFVPSGRP
jgi:hypothetical protein